MNIQQDFEKMISLSNGNSQIQEEKSIQLYSKILFYYSYLWRLKDNYIKALSYLTLALNLLKIYFLKFGFALEQSIYSIYGKEIANQIIPVSFEYQGIKINGVIGKPIIARSNRSNQIFYIPFPQYFQKLSGHFGRKIGLKKSFYFHSY